MTAVVVSLQQPMGGGGPSFGEYHRQQHHRHPHPHRPPEEDDNDDNNDEEEEELHQSNNTSLKTTPANDTAKLSLLSNCNTNRMAPASSPSSSSSSSSSHMDGTPRSQYSLLDEEDEDEDDEVVEDSSQQVISNLSVQSHDSEDYVVVDRVDETNQDTTITTSTFNKNQEDYRVDDDDSSIPSLNDMEIIQTEEIPLLVAPSLQEEKAEDISLLANNDNHDDDFFGDDDVVSSSFFPSPMDGLVGDLRPTPFAPIASPFALPSPPKQLPWGGLNNLGNTCYLNSALQMVASLDAFGEQLQTHIPATELLAEAVVNADSSAADASSSQPKETLRQALVHVLERLAKGETFAPRDFKSKVDERSTLFIGYRQQDAHEFLTTLLDLVDEDYKKKPQEEEEQQQQVEDEEMKDAPSSAMTTSAMEPVDTSSEANAAASVDDSNSLEEEDQQMDDGSSSPVKKQRLDQEQEHEVALPEVTIPSLTTSQSFKDLEFQDIEHLLHGDGTTAATCASNTSNAAGKGEGPKCKLVGGRMSPSGFALTRWEEENDVDAASPNNHNGVKPMTEGDDESTSLAAEEEKEIRPFSPVDDCFTTEVRVCLTCDSCKYRRSHTETYLHLSLEIGPTIGSIEEGLRAFFKPEKREIKCEKCFCETALQTTDITKLPRALLFHLKRFIVDISPDYTSISYRKDQSPVAFEPHLELDEHSGALGEVIAVEEVVLPRNSRYGIRSVVNHIGSSASCGHYTADACRQRRQQDDNQNDSDDKMSTEDSAAAAATAREWIRFNDSYVSQISKTEAVDNASSTAYMVLYELEPITTTTATES